MSLKDHKYKIWGLTGFLTVATLLTVLYISGWIPSLGFLLKPVMLIFYAIGGFLLLIGFVVYKMRGSDGFPQIRSSSGTDVDEQLSKKEAKALAKWDMFEREEPVMVGKEIRCNVKPVTNRDEGTAIRVFEWVFQGRNEAETYCYQMSLDQSIDFRIDWIENLTPENLENLNDAVKQIQNPSLERKSYVSGDWEEVIQDNREEIGQAVRDRNVVEYLDEEGNIQKREKRNVVQVSAESPGQKPQTNKGEQEE